MSTVDQRFSDVIYWYRNGTRAEMSELDFGNSTSFFVVLN